MCACVCVCASKCSYSQCDGSVMSVYTDSDIGTFSYYTVFRPIQDLVR